MTPPRETVVSAPALRNGPTGVAVPSCPVDRLSRRRRNQVCIWILALGITNILGYTLIYAALGGDAHNGTRSISLAPDGRVTEAFFLRGHHLSSPHGRPREVTRATWIYSYLHSISIPLTAGAMIISMLILARPHILATMRDGWISGETFVVAFATIVILSSAAVTFFFTWEFLTQLTRTS